MLFCDNWERHKQRADESAESALLPSSLSRHTVLESAYRPGSTSRHRPINELSSYQVRLVLSGVISLQSLLPPVPCVGLSGSVYIYIYIPIDCVCVCICMYIYIYTYTYTYTYTHTHTQYMGSTTQARCQRAGIWDKVGRRGYSPSCLIL